MHLTPLAAISASVALPFSSMARSVKAMLAPSSANLRAMALPMPRAAPVMSAVFPVNNPILIVYIIDYKSSPLKKEDLLLYIQRLGIIADIDFKDTSYEEKEEMILLYMNSQHFHHFTSFNATIMNCVYKTKNTFLRLKGSCLTSDEEDLFVTNSRLEPIDNFTAAFNYLIPKLDEEQEKKANKIIAKLNY